MDVEMVKSTTEDHMDMMTMMLQLEEKLHDFSEPAFHTSPTLLPPEIHFSNDTLSSTKISMAAMREMIFRIAVVQPIHICPDSVKPPKRRNVKISKDPRSVAARHRRERINERIRILQRLVPGGTKMDTASMLDEVVHYVKFLKRHVQSLEQAVVDSPMGATMDNIITYSTLAKAHHH
ncbi:hypothetical protein GQ457_04G018570 [Hibiscus cannabinus]